MMQLRTIALAILFAPAALAAQGRQTQANAFTMSERIPDGQWIRIRNMSGDVRVRPSTSDRVEITATKSWRRGDPKDVRIEMRKAANGSILVCAFWTANATCTENSYDSHGDGNWRRNDDVAVDFEVRVPKGVRVGAWSVNGGVSVDGVSNEVLAGTVNGSVDATSAGGPVQASTVNGSVRASMGRLDGSENLTFSTVNGTVVAEFAGDVDADVDLSTVNGHVGTDWPITMTGRIDPRHLRATIGRGGRRIKLSTVNGNVELRKR